MARKLALSGKFNIHVVDERNHIAGNCYTEVDTKTEVTVHQYRPHVFNTDKLRIWKYIQQFSEFAQYIHCAKTVTQQGIFLC